MNIFWSRYCKNWINFEIWNLGGGGYFFFFLKKKNVLKKVSCLESPKVHLGSNNFEFWWLFLWWGGIFGSEFISNQIWCYLMGGGGGGWRGLKYKSCLKYILVLEFLKSSEIFETFCKWPQPSKATTVQMHRDHDHQLSRSAFKRWRVYKPIISKKCLPTFCH